MPRYLVERDFPDGFDFFLTGTSVQSIVGTSDNSGVTWLCSYITDNHRHTFCLCEAAGPEAIRKAAQRAGMPIGVIRRISVLEAHAYPE